MGVQLQVSGGVGGYLQERMGGGVIYKRRRIIHHSFTLEEEYC